MQYGGSSLTAIQSQVPARAQVFVFLQSESEHLTFSKWKKCNCSRQPSEFGKGHGVSRHAGLRRGELAGLKWEDVDFKNLHVSVTRSLVDQHVGPVKTEASRKLMPIDEYVARDLLAWYEETPYKKPSDYLWASDANRAGAKRGKQPVWLSTVMRDHIQPSREARDQQKMSWHTFRHTFSTLLKGNGEDAKVVQELLRHSTRKMTLDTYTQALSPDKRAAQSQVVGMIRRKQVVPSLYRGKLTKSRQVIDKVWRPRRDLNPCYRRERAMS